MLPVNSKIAVGALLSCLTIIQGCATSDSPSLGAALASAKTSYVKDSADSVVMSGQKECVRSSSWNEANVMAECDDIAVAEPAPAPGSALVSYNGRALFEFDSAAITSAGRAELDALTARLNAQSEIRGIEIVGHADSVGTDQYNQTLSESRANAVKAYLQQTLQSVAVSAKGMGETTPVADNDTEDGRRKNRRVDVNIAAMVEQ